MRVQKRLLSVWPAHVVDSTGPAVCPLLRPPESPRLLLRGTGLWAGGGAVPACPGGGREEGRWAAADGLSHPSLADHGPRVQEVDEMVWKKACRIHSECHRPGPPRLTVQLRSCASSSPDPPLCPACPCLACGAGGGPPGLTRALLLGPLRSFLGAATAPAPGALRTGGRWPLSRSPQPREGSRGHRVPGHPAGLREPSVVPCTCVSRPWCGSGRQGVDKKASSLAHWLAPWRPLRCLPGSTVTPLVSPSCWQGSGPGRTPPAPRATPAPWPPWLAPGL